MAAQALVEVVHFSHVRPGEDRVGARWFHHAHQHQVLAADQVDAAQEAFPAWAAKKPRERAEILRKAFEIIIHEQCHAAVREAAAQAIAHAAHGDVAVVFDNQDGAQGLGVHRFLATFDLHRSPEAAALTRAVPAESKECIGRAEAWG